MQGFDPNGPQFQDAGMPQPPQLQPPPQVQLPPPQAPGPTLGQVGDAAHMAPPPAPPGTPPATGGNDYLAQYEQALQVTQRMVAPAMRDVPPPIPAPGLLENLATFGMAGLAHREQQAHEHDTATNYNKALQLHAADLARQMVDNQAKSKALEGEAAVRNANLALSLVRTQTGVDSLAHREFQDSWKNAYGMTVPPPKNAQEADALGAQGYGPSQRFPGRLEKNPTGGWSMPGPGPAPGSPAAAAFGGGGGGGGGDTAAPSNLGDVADTLRKKTAQAKKDETLSIPTGTTRTMTETAPKVLDAIQAVRDDLAKIKTGPVSSRMQSFGTALGLPNPNFKQYQTDVGLLRAVFMRMHMGARGGGNVAALEQYKQMIDAGKDSPQNMGASLDALEKYTNSIVKHGAQGIDTSTTNTPTSTTPPSTGGASTKRTAGQLGTPPASLEDLLTKHGY